MIRIKDFFWKIKTSIKSFISLFIRKYVPKHEIWGTSTYIVKDILRRIEAFKKYDKHGFPSGIYKNMEEYEQDLDRIIDGLKMYLYYADESYKKYIEGKYDNPHEEKPENKTIFYTYPKDGTEETYHLENVHSVDEIPKEHIPFILKETKYKTIEEWGEDQKFYFDMELFKEHQKFIVDTLPILNKVLFDLWD